MGKNQLKAHLAFVFTPMIGRHSSRMRFIHFIRSKNITFLLHVSQTRLLRHLRVLLLATAAAPAIDFHGEAAFLIDHPPFRIGDL